MTTVKGEYKLLLERLGDGRYVSTIVDQWNKNTIASTIGVNRYDSSGKALAVLHTHLSKLDDEDNAKGNRF